MTPLNTWEPVLGLPDTLEKLLKETEINNSFRESTVTDTLKNTMESSYAYLYRMQKDSVNYSRFHFQTREFLLNTTYNDIHTNLKKYGDELMELEKSENPDPNEIARLKRLLAELGEVRFGDLYLDEKRRVCVNIDHDVIAPEVREAFRISNHYRNILPLATLMTDKKLFREIPIAIMDGEVRMDIGVYPLEQGTKIVFNHMTARDLYNNRESQIFHDFSVMFIPNVTIEFSKMKKDDVLSGNIPYNANTNRLKNGLYFVVVRGDKHSSHLIPGVKEDTTLKIVIDKKVMKLIDESTNDLEVSVILFQDLYKYDFTLEDDGNVTTKNRAYISEEMIEEIVESKFFIPMINNSILSMPVPEDNILIMKSIYDDSGIDRYEPMYECGVTLHYPNMYQIKDPNMSLSDKYEVYFFYKEVNDVKYTPLFDFYWNYLKSRYNDNYSLEEVINKIYFREDGYTFNDFLNEKITDLNESEKIDLKDEFLDAFYSLFEKMLSYTYYKYNYGTPDFISEYQGEQIPLQYKIARMMEFIKSDWKVLPEYVKSQRKKETLFHFFTNTVNLEGRFRRSTREEDKENDIFIFANSAKLTDADNVNALKVTDNSDYDKEYEVYIEDAKLILPTVQVGDYVEFTDLEDRYVFAFKNPGKDFLAMKIYIDGLLCTNLVTINSLGTDYLYLPVDLVNENSYIMMELEWVTEDPQIEEITFSDKNEWKTIHLIETDRVEYTMDDVVLKVNGVTVKDSEYTVKLIRNEVPYSMYDERHDVVNKYGIVTDVYIQLTNTEHSFPVTVEVQVNKTSIINSGVSTRNGYPRFGLSALKLNPDIKYARMYYNGRIAPPTTFRLVDSHGRQYIQSRIFCQKGDQYLFEFSPYAKDVVCEMVEFDPNSILDMTEYIDKPLDPEYYEVYVNGRRLGLPNLFAFGPNKAVFRGLKSKYLLTIYEKERDFEYFGYSKLFKDGETYFYLPTDLVNEEFMSKDEISHIIDEYINKVKHEDAIILPNEDSEPMIEYDIEEGLIEEMKIFFFEELLPLGLGNPDEVQFNKAYFSEVFPNFTKEFMIEGSDSDPDVIFLNPDVTARIYDSHTNDYEIIDTADSDTEKAFVMVTGESK